MHYTYLLINILSVLFPLLFSFETRFKFYREWKYLIPAILITALFFVVWDIWFTSMGVWRFSELYTTGFKLINLPVEEVLFFLAIPYSSLFLYVVFEKTIFSRINLEKVRHISLIIIPLFIFISINNFDRIYTFTAFILTSFTLGFLYFFRWQKLGLFLVFYGLLLIPFFLVNGLLTGSFLGRVVVSYDPLENLGVRLLTIPIEDSVYGMLMMLFNITLYEHFKKRY